MRYLVINGSARKGNTWKLAELAMERLLKTDSSLIIEQIHLAELNLPFCLGCSNCFRKGDMLCPHSEKMQVLLNAIEQADGVIVVSATYNMRETGLLKNLFDHMCYLLHRPRFFTKKALVITTVGAVGGSSAAKSIEGTLRGIGFNNCYKASIMARSWNDYMPGEGTVRKLEKLTDKFHKDVVSKKMHYQSFGVLIPYNLFRGMCKYHVSGTEYETVDGEHWTDITRSKRAYDSRIPLRLTQKVMGALLYTIGSIIGKHVKVTYKK